MDRRCAGHVGDRGVESLRAELARLLGPRLHIGLVDLRDIGTGGEQVLNLGVDRGGIVRRHLAFILVLVEVILRQLVGAQRYG